MTGGRSTARFVSKRAIGVELHLLEDGRARFDATLLDPYHLIRLSLTVDPGTRTVVDADAEFAKAPYEVCFGVSERARALVGLRIGRGVMREVARKVGGGEGCVHLRELAFDAVNFAATALIGVERGFGLMSRDFNELPSERKHEMSKDVLEGTCRAYQARKEADAAHDP